MTAPALLLIHGLGATSGVWHDVRSIIDWPGRVIAQDLPGHGAADWTGDYTIGAMAAGVSNWCDPGESVVILGHSLGGAVGLCLASGFFRPKVETAIGIGVKVEWSDEEVAGIAKVAAKGIRWFDSEAEATERFLMQAGLNGLVGADHPAIENAVVEEDGRWRVSQDPATFAQNGLATRALLDAAMCPVLLGAGERDTMVNEAELSTYVHEPQIAPGCGHNVQIDDPDWMARLLPDVS